MYEELARRIREYVISSQHRPIPFPAAKQEDIEEAERHLGFRVPEALKALYLNVGNGGFGPGSGGRIIGLRGGDSYFSGTIVEVHDKHKSGAAWDGDEWKDGLLPFCGWGGSIFSCVDCTDGKYNIYESEFCEARKQDYTLDDFFSMWLAGVEILDVDKTPRVSAEIINPFTGTETRVFGRRKKTGGDGGGDAKGKGTRPGSTPET